MPEIHIEISCDGEGFPSPSEYEMRYALEDALGTEDVGEVVDAGGGMGVMDIFVKVDDVATAVAKTKAIVQRLGLQDRTTVEPFPEPHQ